MKRKHNQINNTSPMLDWIEALEYITGLEGFILKIELYWKGTLELAGSSDFSHLWCLKRCKDQAKDLIRLECCPSSLMFKIQH